MVRVAGTADADWFLRSGRAGYDAIAAHVPLAEIESVLDFGCGCGRVTRYWSDFAGAVAGSDVNREGGRRGAARTSPFAPLRARTRSRRRSSSTDESFDLVYALSVFTHLTAELQLAWRDELRRVLRPGGLLLLTTHGRSYLPRLDDDERARFERGELVVRWGDVAGTNLCSAYHPERVPPRHVRATASRFSSSKPEGARGNPTQDLVLLQKT